MGKGGELLLDTCAAIWITQGEPIAPDALAAIDDAGRGGRPLRLSLITAWELGLLAKWGKAAMSRPPASVFAAFLELSGIVLEGLTSEILIDSSLLPGDVHGDPADRIIIATARALDLTIVTRDRLILDYGAAGHVRVLAC